ncbi:21105_t:CDS:2, partial [Gigaspora rosea]
IVPMKEGFVSRHAGDKRGVEFTGKGANEFLANNVEDQRLLHMDYDGQTPEAMRWALDRMKMPDL